MRTYLLLMFIAMGATVLLTPAVRRLALSFNVLTPLRERDVHIVPTPRMGGVAITLGFGLALLLGAQVGYLQPIYEGGVIWTVLIGALAICLLGAVDDVWELDWMAKLGGQLIITGWMAFNGVQLISFPVFGLTIGSARLSIVVSVLVMVTVINAVNFIDGLDGLAAGVVAIGAASFFLYSYLLSRLMNAQTYATAAAVIMIALVGACIGFLWFNFHPASIFMGDSGSMVLGLVMAAAAIIVTGQVNPAVLGDQAALAALLPVLLPLVVVAIPLVDLVWTAVGRLLQGKSPFVADRTHLHDRLLDLGHSHRGVVAILYAWTALAAGVGVALLLFPPGQVVAVAGALSVVLILASLYLLPGVGRRWGWRRSTTRGIGVPGGPVLVDDGIEVISRPQITWKQTFAAGLARPPAEPEPPRPAVKAEPVPPRPVREPVPEPAAESAPRAVPVIWPSLHDPERKDPQ
ncbi:undecaprenyl/decaprenyl-phosphate alpha-N-acetylglucosaminyl 1-phosphate transferase [Actinomyces sp. F1_1611]